MNVHELGSAKMRKPEEVAKHASFMAANMLVAVGKQVREDGRVAPGDCQGLCVFVVGGRGCCVCRGQRGFPPLFNRGLLSKLQQATPAEMHAIMRDSCCGELYSSPQNYNVVSGFTFVAV